MTPHLRPESVGVDQAKASQLYGYHQAGLLRVSYFYWGDIQAVSVIPPHGPEWAVAGVWVWYVDACPDH